MGECNLVVSSSILRDLVERGRCLDYFGGSCGGLIGMDMIKNGATAWITLECHQCRQTGRFLPSDLPALRYPRASRGVGFAATTVKSAVGVLMAGGGYNQMQLHAICTGTPDISRDTFYNISNQFLAVAVEHATSVMEANALALAASNEDIVISMDGSWLQRRNSDSFWLPVINLLSSRMIFYTTLHKSRYVNCSLVDPGSLCGGWWLVLWREIDESLPCSIARR